METQSEKDHVLRAQFVFYKPFVQTHFVQVITGIGSDARLVRIQFHPEMLGPMVVGSEDFAIFVVQCVTDAPAVEPSNLEVTIGHNFNVMHNKTGDIGGDIG